MAKINASTGQVIKKPTSDVHAPHDIEPVQPPQQIEEQDTHYDMSRDPQAINDRVDDDDQADESGESTNTDGPEEELSLVDDNAEETPQ